jgi:hypothetical protein
MNSLSAMFGSNPAAEICFGSIVFLSIYLVGFVFLQKWSRLSGRIPVLHRHLIPGLGAAFAATGVGFWLHAANVAMASAEATDAVNAMPVQELHHSVKSMPIQTFEDQSLVFPGRH